MDIDDALLTPEQLSSGAVAHSTCICAVWRPAARLRIHSAGSILLMAAL